MPPDPGPGVTAPVSTASGAHSAVATGLLPTLHIRAHGRVQYQARVFKSKTLVGEPTVHSSVEEAIRAYGQGGSAEAGYCIWYEGCTIGALPQARMREDAASLAQRLIVLAAVMR